MIRFSASKAPLLTKCKYPFRPDVDVANGNGGTGKVSDDAQCGRALHRMAECHINGPERKLEEAAREFGVEHHLPRLARSWIGMRQWIDTREIAPIAEVKFALDVHGRRARRLTAPGERDYSEAGEHETPMTIDVVTFDGDAMPSFRDWKTGYTAEGYWPQIAVNALAVAYWVRAEHPELWDHYQAVEGGLLHVTGEGVNEDRVRVFDRYELTAIAQDLAGDLAAVPASAPTPGPHCLDLHCPAFRVCPATVASVAAVAQLVPAHKLVRHEGYTLSPRIHSADHAAWEKHQLRTFYSYADTVEQAVADFVGETEHELEDGSVLKKTYREVPRLSTADLIALARGKGANDEEIAACTRMNRESAGIRVVRPKKNQKERTG